MFVIRRVCVSVPASNFDRLINRVNVFRFVGGNLLDVSPG